MIAIDLSTQHALNADRKATQQINFTGSLVLQNKMTDSFHDSFPHKLLSTNSKLLETIALLI